jgi:hypothetical protein
VTRRNETYDLTPNASVVGGSPRTQEENDTPYITNVSGHGRLIGASETERSSSAPLLE